MKTSAIILVGGEGTRLRPLTLELPKPVVPVLDRPFLRFQLDLLRGAGITDIVLCVAFRPERIRTVLGEARKTVCVSPTSSRKHPSGPGER